MKNILLLFISLIALHLSAQDVDFKPISTGVKVGTEVGFMSLKASENKANTTVDLGYSLMVDFLEYRFNAHWSANLGVGFTNRNYSQNIEKITSPDISLPASGRESILVQNIEVPLTARYYITPQNKFRHYYLSFGGSIYYNLHHNSKQEIFFSDGSTWEFYNPHDLTRATYAATFGAGVELKTNYRISYIVEAVSQMNFNQVPFEYGRDANMLGSIGFLVGVKF